MAPSLFGKDGKELLYRARQYFAMERMAVLKSALPDSSYDDLEIAMKDESDQDLKAAYEKFCGAKLELPVDGMGSGITVPAETANRIMAQRKTRRRNKR